MCLNPNRFMDHRKEESTGGAVPAISWNGSSGLDNKNKKNTAQTRHICTIFLW